MILFTNFFKKINSSGTYAKPWPKLLETTILVGLIAALARSIYFINIGFDSHHDYYAFAPGLFVTEGLIPHTDFYTHYGAIEAAIKAFLLNSFGNSLLSLRISLLSLNFIGLLAIAYLCELKRNFRLPLLCLILVWLTFDPTSAAAQVTSKGHFSGWSSDVAFFLICIYFIFTYWNNKLLAISIRPKYTSTKQTKIRKSGQYEYKVQQKGSKISRLNFRLRSYSITANYTLGLGIGFILGCIFFSKFTIGGSMILALILSHTLFLLVSIPTEILQGKNNALKFKNVFLFVKDELLLKYILTFSLPIVLGFAVAIAVQLNLIGGISSLPSYISDTYSSQFETFQGGKSFGILRPFKPIITDYSLIGLFAAILIFTNLRTSFKIALLIISLLLIFDGTKLDLLGFVQGDLETANYTKLFGYIIATVVLIGTLKLFINLQRTANLSTKDVSFVFTSVPIGLFSLTQFYPVTDPFHIWWAVGTALPATAFLIVEFGGKKSIKLLRSVGLVMIPLTISFILASTLLTLKMLTNTPFDFVISNSSNIDFLRTIRSADSQSSVITQDVENLINLYPKSILLESGYGSFLDLVGSPKSRRAYAKCKITPLSNIKSKDFSERITCLTSLKRDGWNIFVTNYGGYLTGKPRYIDGKLVAPYAVLDFYGEPSIVKESAKGTFSRKTFGELIYWELN